MERTLLVELKEYNIDYKWEVKDSYIVDRVIEKFAEEYSINCHYRAEDLINDYIGYDLVENDFLDDVVEDEMYRITEEFEVKMADLAIELLLSRKSLSNEELEQELSKQYPTIIVKWSSGIWYNIEDILEYKSIVCDVDDEKETITLREAK